MSDDDLEVLKKFNAKYGPLTDRIAGLEVEKRFLAEGLAAANVTIAAQDNLLAKGIHSCHDACKFDQCVNRRLREENARLKEWQLDAANVNKVVAANALKERITTLETALRDAEKAAGTLTKFIRSEIRCGCSIGSFPGESCMRCEAAGIGDKALTAIRAALHGEGK